jgi:hypothetical protein
MVNEGIVSRMIRAAKLDKTFYNEVRGNTSLTKEALLVVIICAAVSGMGSIIGGAYSYFEGTGFNTAIVNLVVKVLTVVLGYFIWVSVAHIIGTRYLGGKGEVSELRRTLGYAMSPLVLNVLVILPCLEIVGLVVWIWTLLAGFIAVRETLKFDNIKALVTVIVGWLIIIVMGVILSRILGIGAFAISAIRS